MTGLAGQASSQRTCPCSDPAPSPGNPHSNCHVPSCPMSECPGAAAAEVRKVTLSPQPCASNAESRQRHCFQALRIYGRTASLADSICLVCKLLQGLADGLHPSVGLLAPSQGELPLVNGGISLAWSVIRFLLQPLV